MSLSQAVLLLSPPDVVNWYVFYQKSGEGGDFMNQVTGRVKAGQAFLGILLLHTTCVLS